jgi:hypothetical protein
MNSQKITPADAKESKLETVDYYESIKKNFIKNLE